MFQGHLGEDRHWLQMILLLVLVLFPKGLHGSSCGESLVVVENPKDGACGEMDIRNNVKNFRMLENCTVIEGSLHISLIDYVPQEEYNKYSFPLLREITGHFMMFRVFGLRSLRNIFPNLAVIRGQTKFFNDYALVAYEMRDLEELGLVGLTFVNGSVRLTRNNKLCHISSIDWGRLAPGVDPAKHLFLDNREEQLCPDYCSESCPSTSYQGTPPRKRCWTSKMDDCQRNLVCQCPKGVSCAPNGSCCSEHCIGGCSGPSSSDCYVCSKVVHHNNCQSRCPQGTYMLSNRRCLTENECLGLLSRSANINRSDSTDNFPKLLVGDSVTPNQCVFKCPPGYTVNDRRGYSYPKCTRCTGVCPKVCNTTIVSSIQDSEKLFGCSKIEGSLEIQITGGKDVDYELTKNLGVIREVTGYIKVWKSYPLLTLHFFDNLEIIGGDKLMHKGYSLFVADNTNLLEIFPEKQMRKIVIRKGRIGFHGNRKLCFSKISSFSKLMNATAYLNESRVDISNTSNGNLIPCKNIILTLNLTYKHQVLILRWDKYPSGDKRQLISYIINYKEVKEPVRDIFQGRDACSDNDWKTKEAKLLDDPQSSLFGLKPYTKYVVYVQASTLPGASDSAMSRLIYFQTSPSPPTDPMDLEVSSSDPHELTVRWNPPKFPNGNVTHYKIFYQMQSPSTNGFEQRDFCKDSNVNTRDVQKEKAKQTLEEEKRQKQMEVELDPRCCKCPMSEEEMLKQQRMRELEITFENDLHDLSYRKILKCQNAIAGNNLEVIHDTELMSKSVRVRRDTGNSSNYGYDINNPHIFHPLLRTIEHSKNDTLDVTANDTASNTSTIEPRISHLRQEVIVYDTVVTLSNLEHFHSYNIEVVACHETDSVTGIKLCGNSAIITGQTAVSSTADNLNSSLVSVEPVVNKTGEVLIKWEPPLLPNGLILKYYLMYRKVEMDRTSNPVVVCVSAKQFHNSSNGYLLHGLLPGNYSIQISAHSLAGNGTYTQQLYFYVQPKHGIEETDSLSLIVGICSGLAILIIMAGVAVFCYHKYRYDEKNIIVSQNPHYLEANQLYIPDEWEVSRDDVRCIKELGKGLFGTVYEGTMENHATKTSSAVAIKMVNPQASYAERMKILKEATTMKVFECHHVIKLFGIVSKGQPALVIMELMKNGDLKNYLRHCRLEDENYANLVPPTNDQLRQMAAGIADGMAYLADNKIVHRDLAARNCLVGEDLTVKIADFGMARDVYTSEYYRKENSDLLPMKWMSPEALDLGVYTSMSDVWSYGIVLWEMVTLAELPYAGLSNYEASIRVIGGRILEPPKGCPEDLRHMMLDCWQFDPHNRPTFKSLLMSLEPFLDDKFREKSYCFTLAARLAEERKIAEEVEDKLRDGEIEEAEADGLVVESSSVFDDKDVEESQVDSPYTAHVSQGFGNLSYTGSSHVEQVELFPLMQHNTEQQLLYPTGVSTANVTKPRDASSEEDDIDSDNDFVTKDDKNYIRPSKDAKSSSERLKLLSDSPASSKPAKSSPFAARSGGKVDEYMLASPSTTGSSKVGEENYLGPSYPATSSETAPFSLANLPSASPILHVNMEGIGQACGPHPNQSNFAEHEGGWLLHNNKYNTNNSQTKTSESNSNSNSSSIQSGNEGSKESSSSSSGSHNRYHPGTANGHGPFTHQQNAVC